MKIVRTSKARFLKFFFTLSMLLVNFSACQNQKTDYSLLFYDLDSYETIGNVSINGIYDKTKYVANNDGYINIPWEVSKDNSMHVSVLFNKEGYVTTKRRFMHNFGENNPSFLIEVVGLRKGKADAKCDNCFSSISLREHKEGNSLYQDAKDFLEIYKRHKLSMN